MSKNITLNPFPLLTAVDEKAKQQYVGEIYAYAEKHAQSAIEWYMDKKGVKGTTARALRLAAILLTTLGGLIPLVVATRVLPPVAGLDYGQFGYIALALAAACIALDKFFGFSSAWMRHLTTAMTLQRLLAEFHIDWAMFNSSLAGSAPNATEREAMLKRVQIFLLRILSETEKETTEWTTEYRSSLSELEKSARQELASSKPGVLNLTVTNAAQFKDGVTVLVNDQPRQTMFSTDCQVSPLFPGDHFVRVAAAINGKQISTGAAVKIATGQSTSLSLTLPVP